MLRRPQFKAGTLGSTHVTQYSMWRYDPLHPYAFSRLPNGNQITSTGRMDKPGETPVGIVFLFVSDSQHTYFLVGVAIREDVRIFLF